MRIINAVPFFLLLAAPACTEYDLLPDEPDAEDPIEVVEPGFPVAVCDVSPNPVTPPTQTATWDGSGSYDPEGEIVSYVWELVSVPAGSAVAMPYATGATVSGFMPDLAGDYVARLTVRNDGGNENSCEATLTATPSQDLWVEMFWEHSGDDMDLHLLAPGGVPRTDQDCYYANCVDWGYGWGLDWGQYGYDGDDPALDLDDIPGTGPENINIDDPVPGVYTVFVHDYPGSVYDGANNVTVNIYLGGVLKWTDTRTISGEDSDNYYATIDWPSGTIQGQ